MYSFPPPALGYHVWDSRGLLEILPPPDFWGFNDSKVSPDLAWPPLHLGPAHLRLGLSLWVKVTSRSRWAEQRAWEGQNEAEDRPAQPPFHSQICLSYVVTSQHLHSPGQPQASQMS